MTDLLLSARLEGDADGLVDAAEEAGGAVDKLATQAEAAQKKIAAAAKEASSASQAAAKAAKDAAGAHDEAARGAGQYADQVKKLAEDAGKAAGQLATGRVSGEAFAASLGRIATAAVGMAGGMATVGAAIAGVFLLGIDRANQLHARATALRLELAALGRADTSATLLGIADRNGGQRGGGDDALQQMLGAGIFDTQLVARGMQQAKQLSATLGGELAPNAKIVADAMAGNGDALEKLDAKLRILNDSERVQIRTLRELGQSRQAAGVIVDALGRRLDGLAEQANKAGKSVSGSIGEAWARALDNFAQTGAVQTAAGWVRNLGDTLATAFAPPAEDAYQKINRLNAELLQVQLRGGNVQLLRDRVLQGGLAGQERDAGDEAARGAGDAYRQSAGDDPKKRVRELIEALDELPRRREQIGNAIKRITDEFHQGKINADEWKASVGGLQVALDSLRSPLERSQSILDNATALANAPRDQRRALASQQRAEEDSLKVPPEQRNEFIYNRREADRQAFRQETRDQLEDLDAASQHLLNAARGFQSGLVGGLRNQAYGDAAERARIGAIEPGAVGSYAQGLLNQRGAGAVAELGQQTVAYREQTEALERLAAAEQLGAAATREAERANQVATATSRARAAAEASGSEEIKRALDEQIAKYEELSRRATDAQRRREAVSFNRQFDPNAAYADNMARMRELQATGLLSERTVAEASKRYEQERLDASRDATDGMIAGLRRYADEATNAGAQAAQGIRSGMQSAENALVEFATTGKITINSLVNSILADLARIVIRQSITGPLSNLLGSLIGNFLGGLGGGGGGGPNVGGGVRAAVAHQGGRMGDMLPGRTVDPMIFASARRFHQGGPILGPSEIPVIAQTGERMLNRQETRDYERGDRGARVVIHNYTGEKVRHRRTRTADGQSVDEILIGQISEKLADQISNASGPMHAAIGNTFGLPTQGH